MNTKLTLRIEESVVARAKFEAKLRGKSVSQMVSEFIESLAAVQPTEDQQTPPVTQSLLGVLKGKKVLESDYKTHLLEKYQ